MFLDRAGRIVVSTTRHAREDSPAGYETWQSFNIPKHGEVVVTHHNNFAHRCYAVEASGTVAWRANGVVGQAAHPNGDIIASNDRYDVVVLRDGTVIEQHASGAESWSVIGWRGETAVLSSTLGAAWVEPFVYAVVDGQLQRSQGGEVLERIPIAREPFAAIDKDLTCWPEGVRFPMRLDLAYNAKLDRFIASHWSLLAWTLCLRRDGTVDWLRLLTDACCNFVCFVGDRIAHTSSCGETLSFLSLAGEVGRTHQLPELTGKIVGDGGTVIVEAAGALHAFDANGEPRWKLDAPNLGGMCFRDGVLYIVSGERGALELSAWS
jgi:outer membrane protein assembly factor BamB